MNTRLQVEHPVTELITGLDLVHLQIGIAAGERLPFGQEDVVIRGHAIECRIYAEDADDNFFPSPGKIDTLLTPAGPGIRLDSGVYAGWTVPLDYDPLLAKLIGYGQDRRQAMARLARALPEYFVAGIKTNLGLFRRILDDEDFQSGKIDTGFLDRLLQVKSDSSGNAARKTTASIAAIAAAVFTWLDSASKAGGNGTASSGGAIGTASSSWKKAARTEGLM
jgi:acetyl-CoA carboxylase, biotin carboxylase subunit